VKRGHNREHPETPKETVGIRGSRWIERACAGGVDRSRGGSLVAGHDLRYKARGSRAWGLSAGGGFRAVSPRGLVRGRLNFGQVHPSM